MYEYTLKLNSTNIHELLKAVELLMKLKLGQYQEIVYDLCDIHSPSEAENVSKADDLLKDAFELIYKEKKVSEYKDKEWFRLYALYQTMRKAIHDAENPEGDGSDSWAPMQFLDEPLPIVQWENRT